jgi:hypothetical protein
MSRVHTTRLPRALAALAVAALLAPAALAGEAPARGPVTSAGARQCFHQPE